MSNQNSYKDTLNLPATDFSIRANAKEKEAQLQERWQREELFARSYEHNKGNEKFVLHDGPPYANGHIHLGHAFNKILKDILCKYQRMAGYHVPLRPGWDCHGLPIEHKVASELGFEKDKSALDIAKLKEACRAFAQRWIEVQREEFRALGVLAHWEHPYYTMHPRYEADILRAFSSFVAQGFIVRKGKTVPWCASCQTVLAAAEIEYEERKDPSIYVLFPFSKEVATALMPTIGDRVLSLLVWTTTPWTIPLNRAVVLHPSARYVVLEGPTKELFIVGKDRAAAISEMLGVSGTPLAEFEAKAFAGRTVHHPLTEKLVPILLDDMVLTSDGTACLHSAPGCGPEDYLLGVREGLEIYSPLTPDGKYDKGIEPVALEGMPVADGQVWVIKALATVGRLLHKTSLRHSYPHCWRCHNGLMFRATDQWFCNLQQHDLVENALKEVEKIHFVPDWGNVRLSATIGSRTEWCISRQRHWGVPIPALLCATCSKAYLTTELVQKVADGVAQEGIAYWDRITVEELKETGAVPKDLRCDCGSTNFVQERDILDVWFDSGVSSYAVLEQDEDLGVPASVYLEGSDQHRGWFQSSLLSSMVLRKKSPTRAIVTHGFTVDEKGHKMSKSRGNVITPQQIIEQYSTDILRLWVASTDFEGDVVISHNVLKNVAEVYRKIRNTCRFLLSNLSGFDRKDSVPYDEMPVIDQYALAQLYEVDQKIRGAYEKFRPTTVFHTLGNYCATSLSSFYLDIIKDRLYCAPQESRERRSAQTVCAHILDTLTGLMAPILSFMAEEVSDFSQASKQHSIHLQNLCTVRDVWGEQRAGQQEMWQYLLTIRDAVLKALEEQRAAGSIKHSLEARVQLYIDPTSKPFKILNVFVAQLGGKSLEQFYQEFFIVSQVSLAGHADGLKETGVPWLELSAEHARGEKCPRCWQWDEQPGEDNLCRRCHSVVMSAPSRAR